MKVWNKETRTPSGAFYRKKDWSVEVLDDFMDTHPRACNFTTIAPPDDKCDWSDEIGGWVVDESLTPDEARAKREKEYPPIGDQLDAIMKWAFSETEIGLPAELKSLAAKCMSVKAKYPVD